MNGGTDRKNRNNSTEYKIILIILFVIITCLIVGIILSLSISRNGSDNDLEDDGTMPAATTVSEQTPDDIVSNEASKMFQDPNIDNSEIESYYDNIINKAINENNYRFAIDIIIQKASFIAIGEGDCEKAKEYANSLDFSEFPEEDLTYLYSHINSAICPNNGEDEL